jgi:hypothetical protein
MYQASDTIEACLGSIGAMSSGLATTILIDDGSTDETAARAREWSSPGRGSYIRQANAGVGAALSRGLDAVRTPFVSFVQADDWIDASVFDRMLFLISNSDADVVRCAMALVNQDGLITSVVDSHSVGPRLVSPLSLAWGTPAIPAGMYRTSFLRRHGISFGSSRYAEDLPFIYGCARHAERVLSVGSVGYFYRQHHGGQLSAQMHTTPAILASLSTCRPSVQEPATWRWAYWRMAGRALAGGIRRTSPQARRAALGRVWSFICQHPRDVPFAVAGAASEAIVHAQHLPRYLRLMRQGSTDWTLSSKPTSQVQGRS